MRKIQRSTRGLLGGLFAAGLFYAIVVASTGRWYAPDVIIAIIIEIALLAGSLIFDPVDKKDLLYISLGIISLL
ncbi:MAG: hypothetical protein ACFFD6_03340, partial [Candidatus Thorarchaeota archaeon]